jgi:hypothetical protein
MFQDMTQSNVISLDAARAEQRQPVLGLVEDCWDSLRAGRAMPTRDEIEPEALTGALAHAFILERVAPGLARFRVAGSHLTALLGMEARGLPISAMFEPHNRDRLAEALETAFATPAVVRAGLRCRASIGRPSLTGGMVLLPLGSGSGELRHLLGALSMSGRIGRPPRRPEILGLARRQIDAAGATASTPR